MFGAFYFFFKLDLVTGFGAFHFGKRCFCWQVHFTCAWPHLRTFPSKRFWWITNAKSPQPNDEIQKGSTSKSELQHFLEWIYRTKPTPHKFRDKYVRIHYYTNSGNHYKTATKHKTQQPRNCKSAKSKNTEPKKKNQILKQTTTTFQKQHTNILPSSIPPINIEQSDQNGPTEPHVPWVGSATPWLGLWIHRRTEEKQMIHFVSIYLILCQKQKKKHKNTPQTMQNSQDRLGDFDFVAKSERPRRRLPRLCIGMKAIKVLRTGTGCPRDHLHHLSHVFSIDEWDRKHVGLWKPGDFQLAGVPKICQVTQRLTSYSHCFCPNIGKQKRRNMANILSKLKLCLVILMWLQNQQNQLKPS